MQLLRFELVKTLKQKKYIWVFLAVVLITGAIFSMNSFQRSRLQGHWAKFRSLDELTPLHREWNRRETDLINKRDLEGLTPAEEKQLEYSREIGMAINRLGLAKRFGFGNVYNQNFQRLLDNLDMFTKHGGEFTPLEGLDREIARGLHNWRLKYDIEYEFERAPLTQHLFLRQSASMLFGIIGLLILLIFFSNTVTEEKEQLTWKTLKVQPISQGKLLFAKYINFILMVVLFIGMVIGVGLLIPLLSEGRTLIIQYPQVLRSEDQFIIVSMGHYILRMSFFFACASSIGFGFSMLISKWVKKSIPMYFVTALMLVAGYLATSFLTTSFNPFFMFNTIYLASRLHSYGLWIYLLSAGLWTSVLLLLATYIPEPEFLTKKGESDIKPFNHGKIKKNNTLVLKLLTFEIRKTRRQGLIKAFAFVMLILIVGGNYLLAAQREERENAYLSELEFRRSEVRERIERLEGMINDLRAEWEELEQREDLRQQFTQSQLQVMVDNILELERILYLEYLYTEKLEAGIVAFHGEEWDTFHQYQLFVNERGYEVMNLGVRFGAPETIRRFSYLVSIHEKQLLIERNIRPVLSGEFISTIHEHWGRQTRRGWNGEMVRQEQWAYENKRVDNSGLFSLYHAFTSYMFLVPLILLIFILGGGFAKEKGKKCTFNFLKTQPISLEKLFLAKSINGFVLMLISLVGTVLVVIITGTVLNRFGDWDFPILHYNSFRVTLLPEYSGLMAGGHGYHFINLGDYLIRGTFLLLFVGLFAFTVTMLFSLFFERSFSVFSATFIVLTGGYWLNARHRMDISQNSPFTYFDIPRIINGELATRLNNPSFNLWSGIIVLTFLSVAIVIVGYWYISKNKNINFSGNGFLKLRK